MIKKRFVCLLVIVFMLSSIFIVHMPVEAMEDEGIYDEIAVAKIIENTNVFNLKAKASLLMDAGTGSVLLENNAHEGLPIASITKIMTMLLVMEAIDSGKLTFEEMVPVSEHSYSMGGSQVYLKPGEEFTVRDMLKAVAVHSANDASVALAEKVAGSEEAFVSMMNEKAKELGMKNTKFLDCSGLTDEGHYSSAYDVALMSRELILKHPAIIDYTTIWHDTFRNGTFSLDNTNKLIRFYDGAIGIKTGSTSKAGFCLSAAAKRNNLLLISVVLGEPDSNTRFAESKMLLNYGFANFETVVINNKGEEVGTVEVKKGLRSLVVGMFGDDVKLLVSKGSKDKITREIVINEDIFAPIKPWQKLGEAIYSIDGQEIGRADIVARDYVQKATFIRLFSRLILEWFVIGRK